MFTLTEIDYHSPAWATIPQCHRQELTRMISCFKEAPDSKLVAWLQSVSVDLGIPFPTLRRKYYIWRNSGCQWTRR